MSIFRLALKKNITNVIAAIIAGGFIYYFLGLIPYYPKNLWLPIVIILFLTWLIKPNLGAVIVLIILLFPIAYNSLTLAIIYFLLLLFVAVIETWAIGPYGILVLIATTLIVLQPKIANLILLMPFLAGFLGIRRGVVLSALSCFWAQVIASLLGLSNIGLLFVNTQSNPLISINPKPLSTLFEKGWLTTQTQVAFIDSQLFNSLLSPFIHQPIHFFQVGLWAISAGIISFLLAKPIIKGLSG